jgi:hypothetical protein
MTHTKFPEDMLDLPGVSVNTIARKAEGGRRKAEGGRRVQGSGFSPAAGLRRLTSVDCRFPIVEVAIAADRRHFGAREQ